MLIWKGLQEDDLVAASREKAPKRRDQQIEQGNTFVPVSEAVAELFAEDEVLCTMGEIQYVCNPHPDSDGDMQEQKDEQLTKGPIRNYVSVGPPEAHIERRSFLLNTGCQTGTTTNSTLRAQFGYIPGAVERFKSKKQLQSDAYEYVQLACSGNADQQHKQKLYARYKLITGLTEDDPLPESVSKVTMCPQIENVAGKIRLYSGKRTLLVCCCCLPASLRACVSAWNVIQRNPGCIPLHADWTTLHDSPEWVQDMLNPS